MQGWGYHALGGGTGVATREGAYNQRRLSNEECKYSVDTV